MQEFYFPRSLRAHEGPHCGRANSSRTALKLAVDAARPGATAPTTPRPLSTRHWPAPLPHLVCSHAHAAFHLQVPHSLAECHCKACKCAAMLHTMPAVDRRLTSACASPFSLAHCYQGALVTVFFPVTAMHVRWRFFVELSLFGAADAGSMSWTDRTLRLAALACRL